MNVSIGVSNRHVHLCKNDLEVLFGKDFELSVKKSLVQPGEFASDSVVSIKTDKAVIDNVRVLGPLRSYTQVEVSLTDAFKLGIEPPVRDSGDLKDSAYVTLVGPKGSVFVQGCIIATRHIHITPDFVKKLSLEDVKCVSVRLGGIKGGILNNVSLKISDKYAFEMHIDTDDANAHLIKSGDVGEIMKEVLWLERFLKI